MSVVIVVESSEKRYTVSCQETMSPISVGRDPTCHVVLNDSQVSRLHLRLYLEKDGIKVEDLSRNGALADGTPVLRSTVAIAFGRPILLGRHTLYVESKLNGVSLPPLEGVNRVSPLPQNEDPRTSKTIVLLPTSRAQNTSKTTIPLVGADTAAHPSRCATARQDLSQQRQSDHAELRREIHKRLLEHLDLATLESKRIDDPSFRPRVLTALRRIVETLEARLPPDVDRDRLVGEMADEALGLGPLEHLLADPEVSEIMVIDAQTIFVEKNGKIERSETRFTDDDRVRAVIERIVTPLGRRIDESSPLVDARLSDGSRVNAIIRPLSLRGSCITIRKFSKIPLKMGDLLRYGTLSPAMGRFLERSVTAKKNIVISGGTGSGKTTLLNVLSAAIPEHERIVTVEDSAELQLGQPHVVPLESRPSNMDGKGAYSIRDLVKNALRMRPDRIVVGECRGGEALDMLQAMNTGHDGSLTTTHANSPAEALNRLQTLCLMAGLNLPAHAIREQIAASVHLIVQQSRLSDGRRRVTSISEVGRLAHNGDFTLRDIYRFVRTNLTEDQRVEGLFAATGYLPSYLDELLVQGLIAKGEAYV